MTKQIILSVLLLSAMALGAKAQDLYEEGVYLYLGTTAHIPRTEYVGNMAGMNLGCTYISESGNAYILDISSAGGMAHKDFHTGEGWIYNRDFITSTILTLDYGHLVKQTEKIQIAPFGGIGLSGYQYNEKEEDDYKSKLGPCFNAGVFLDWNFCRTKRGFKTYHGLHINPYLAVTFLRAPVKIVPSLNISVSYFLRTDNL